MIQVSPQTRILVEVEAVDFRNGIDGLARVCQEQLQADPFSGRLFVFRNRRRTALKILAYDGRGFWLCKAMGEYASRRGWTIALQVREVNSEVARREAREKLIEAARFAGLDP